MANESEKSLHVVEDLQAVERPSGGGDQPPHGEDERRRLLLDEYRDIGPNWRYWGEIRFKQLTVFLTATGALAGAALATRSASDKPVPLVILSILGILLSALFFFLEERATYYRRSYLHWAIKLEELLGLWQYRVTHNPYWPGVRSEYLFRAFFSAIYIGWSVLLAAGLSKYLWVRVLIVLVFLPPLSVGWEVGANLQAKAGDVEERKRLPRPKRKELRWLLFHLTAWRQRIRR